MIDEKKLIEELSRNSIFEKVIVGEETVYDIIDRLPKVGEWIPCSERLPVPYEDLQRSNPVIVTYLSWHDNIPISDSVAFYDHQLKCWKWYESYDSVNVDVIAWMPLPEPYKEGEDA